MQDDSHLIIDYKTAKFTAHQDELFPMYEVQLNAYAVIGEQKGFAPVSGLALVYTEPVTDDATAAKDANQTDSGFLMEFSAHIRPVDLAPDKIPPLLAKVREIYRQEAPSQAARGLRRLRPAARPHRVRGRVTELPTLPPISSQNLPAGRKRPPIG